MVEGLLCSGHYSESNKIAIVHCVRPFPSRGITLTKRSSNIHVHIRRGKAFEDLKIKNLFELHFFFLRFLTVTTQQISISRHVFICSMATHMLIHISGSPCED